MTEEIKKVKVKTLTSGVGRYDGQPGFYGKGEVIEVTEEQLKGLTNLVASVSEEPSPDVSPATTEPVPESDEEKPLSKMNKAELIAKAREMGLDAEDANEEMTNSELKAVIESLS